MTTHPKATSFFLITFIFLAILFALFFDREIWCRYICPLGNFAGLFSLSAILFVRSNPNVCSTKCTTHNCHKGSDQYVRPPLVRMWQQLDIAEAIGFFILVCFFLAPCMLASDRIPLFMGDKFFTLAVLTSLVLAAVCRYILPTLLFGDDEFKKLRTARLMFVLLLLAWGPFAAFEFGHLPGFDTLFIITDQQSMLQAILPDHGISLLALAQLGAIWFGALMAVVTLLGIGLRIHGESTRIARPNWYLFFAICLFYPLLNSLIVL
jgi:hypothetical protein